MSNSTARRLREVANDPQALAAVIAVVRGEDPNPNEAKLVCTVGVKERLIEAADQRTEAHNVSATPTGLSLFVKAEDNSDFRTAVVRIINELVDKEYLVATDHTVFAAMGAERGHAMHALKLRVQGKNGSTLVNELLTNEDVAELLTNEARAA